VVAPTALPVVVKRTRIVRDASSVVRADVDVRSAMVVNTTTDDAVAPMAEMEVVTDT